jgi:hypothetical protein
MKLNMANPTTITWTPPVANTNNSPILTGEITGYTVGIRDVNAAGSVAGTYTTSFPASATATSALIPALAPGSYAAAVQADTVNSMSAWSAETLFSVVLVPNPPTNVALA